MNKFENGLEKNINAFEQVEQGENLLPKGPITEIFKMISKFTNKVGI